MLECSNCGEGILFEQKYENFPGEKGSLDLTEAELLCEDCHPSSELSKEQLEKLNELFPQSSHKALELFKEVFNQEMSSHWFNKGELLYDRSQEEALNCYNEALSRNTHNSEAWYRKGWILANKNEFDRAAKCFENVAELEGMPEKELKAVEEENDWRFEDKSRSLAATLGRALSLRNQYQRDEFIEQMGILNYYLRRNPPFEEMNDQEFVEWCLDNWKELLQKLEPSASLQEPLENKGYFKF